MNEYRDRINRRGRLINAARCIRFANFTASTVLDAVEAWAVDCKVIRETAIVPVEGRLDALLVPVGYMAPCLKAHFKTTAAFWTKPQLFGIEVKVSRADFNHGLKNGQYERYAKALGGLYIAVPHGLVKKAEVPDYCGLLVCFAHGVCKCVKHPKVSDTIPTIETAWKLMFWLKSYYEEREADWRHKVKARLGSRMEDIINTAMNEAIIQVKHKGKQ